ncbi:MAG: asparagine synthase (glutamine-hydrolyzing) [Planctomycetes bacterium]|nr:asparagine synthase (glutamine-hydrolyzing) [Planctomycetota bacterium]
MCGIVGQVGQLTFKAESLEALRHRGPDAQGEWTNHRNCVLGHTRLSILDLHDRADQPMTDPSGRFTLVFNGEIYNYLELRQDHLAAQAFRTTSDTEVLLSLWRKMGPECLNLLRGMFAFAIWDNQDNRLWMARDRFGKKPLVYHTNGNTLTFASELRALRLCTPNSSIEPKAVDLFMGYQFIPGPYTIYRNTYKLPPAHYAVWDGTSLTQHRYWQLQFAPAGSQSLSEEAAADQLDQQLKEAVAYRLRADVPVGCLLSGGVDSSLVTALAAQASPNIKTFTIGFKEQRYDEREYAQQVADLYHTDHRCYELSVEDSEAYLDKAVAQYGEPYGDSSALPTLMVCEQAARDVKVTLCGDGGDELLAGYSFFRLKPLDRLWPSGLAKRHSLGQALDAMREGHAPHGLWARGFKGLSKIASPLSRSLIYEHYVRQYDRSRLYQSDFLAQVEPNRLDYQQRLLKEIDPATDPLNQLLAIHYAGYFTGDLLVKTDIASMAYGLEIRAPLLDHTLMEFAATLPAHFKFRDRTGKYLLKKVAGRYLPDALLHRKKRGFSVPVADWMRSHFNARVRDMAATPGLRLWEYLDPSTVTTWMDQHEQRTVNHGKRLWLIMQLGLWLETP